MAKYKLLADQWDQVLSKPTEPFRFVRHRKGATVDLTGADESRLLRIGAVEPVKRSASKSTKSEQTQASDKPKGDEGDDDGGQDAAPEDGPDAADDGSAGAAVVKPAKTGPVAAWREFAVSQGHDPAEAEEASRADLIALYG